MTCNKPIGSDQDEPQDLSETVRALIAQVNDPAKVLELYYWSLEPGLLECIRAIVLMPIEARAALMAFLSVTSAGQTITATFDTAGTLSLRSPAAEKILTTYFNHSSRLQN